MTIRIGIIGDVHLHFNQRDVDYFNASDYSLLLFVGDLVNYRSTRLLLMGDMLGRLTKPVYMIPGNHDGTSILQLLAEITDQSWLRNLSHVGSHNRVRLMTTGLSRLTLCGYSLHPFEFGDIRFDVIAARPHAMGGGKLSFPRQIKRDYGVASMQQSTERLINLVESSTAERIIFLAHNGPTGLGHRRNDIWGCDFRRAEGDFGDPDLRTAIDAARNKGKTVSAVVAGHMHHHLKGGGIRTWHLQRDNTHYINAARVPRIESSGESSVHHHICLELTETNATIEAMAISY